MSSVVELEQLRSDLHTWVDAHVAVELHVGVKDFTVEVFDALDNAKQWIRTLMLTKAELHNIVADKTELP